MLIDKNHKIDKLGDPIIAIPGKTNAETTPTHVYGHYSEKLIARVPATLNKDDTTKMDEARIAPEAFALARKEASGISNMSVKLGAKGKIGDAHFLLHKPNQEPGKTPCVRELEQALAFGVKVCTEPLTALGINVKHLSMAAEAIGAKKIALFRAGDRTLIIKPINNIDDPNGPLAMIPEQAVFIQEELDLDTEDSSEEATEESSEAEEPDITPDPDLPQPSTPPQPEPVDQDEPGPEENTSPEE